MRALANGLSFLALLNPLRRRAIGAGRVRVLLRVMTTVLAWEGVALVLPSLVLAEALPVLEATNTRVPYTLNFGCSVAVSGDLVVAGMAPDPFYSVGEYGSVSIYRRDATNWCCLEAEITSPAGNLEISVAVSGSNVVWEERDVVC